MATMLDLCADTRRAAYGSLHDQINLVSEDAAAGATTIKMDMDVSGITPGMVLSCGLNVWYVRAIDNADNSVQVIPGFDNSPEKAVSVGDFVFIKPRVTDWYLFNLMNEEIVRLSAPENGLYQIKSWTVDSDPTWQTYAIPAEAFNMVGLLRVRFRMPGSTDVWYDIPDKAYRMQLNIDEDDSFIRLLRNIPGGTEVQFLYKAPFAKADDLSDDVQDVCGLSSTMLDIPPLGALATLMRTTESRRNQVQQQGDARRSSEVSPGANIQVGSRVEREHQARIREELARLVQRVPVVRSL